MEMGQWRSEEVLGVIMGERQSARRYYIGDLVAVIFRWNTKGKIGLSAPVRLCARCYSQCVTRVSEDV